MERKRSGEDLENEDVKKADVRASRKLDIAVVCSSNQNRSMEAHGRLRFGDL
jgi:hypothetical protein